MTRILICLPIILVSIMAMATTAQSQSNSARVDPRLTDEGRYLFGVLGRSSRYLGPLREAGVDAKVLEFSWRAYFSSPGQKNQAYVQAQRKRLADLKNAGFVVVLNLGINDSPAWIHDQIPDSRYVNQFGDAYAPLGADGQPLEDAGDLNSVFNPQVRRIMEQYIAELFSDFPAEHFDAVRLGFGRYGEIQYPLPSVGGRRTYWAFDAHAQKSCPVPGWKPGQPSPDGEARQFIEWYLNALVDTQQWLTQVIRRHYAGPIFALYPNWGLRPGQIDDAVSVNLNGTTFGETKGQLPLGLDFQRLVTAIEDPDVWVYTTCLNKSDLVHESDDPRDWSAVRYLAHLAQTHPLKLNVIGENAAPHERFYMEFTMQQMERYGLRGMFWAFEYQLFQTNTEWRHFASIDDLRDMIGRYSRREVTR